MITPMLNKQHAQEWGRFCHVVYPLGFALRATTQHVGKAGELQILCCQGIKVTDYNFTLDALALKPSGFCNVRDSHAALTRKG